MTEETMLRDPQQIEPLAEPLAEAVDIPRRHGLTLMQLTSQTCRWPIGDLRSANFCFCGATTSVQPYCEVHRAIAYRAPEQRR
jgi:GcrA cell cycle regulator